MERKTFIKSVCMLCGVAAIPVAFLESCKKQTFSGPSNVNFTLDLTQSANSALNTAGGSLVTNGILIIRVNNATFTALSATCTHQGCTVGYNSGAQDIVCPCHGGTYNLSGAVIAGPPPSNLTQYSVTQSANTITIKS